MRENLELAICYGQVLWLAILRKLQQEPVNLTPAWLAPIPSSQNQHYNKLTISWFNLLHKQAKPNKAKESRTGRRNLTLNITRQKRNAISQSVMERPARKRLKLSVSSVQLIYCERTINFFIPSDQHMLQYIMTWWKSEYDVCPFRHGASTPTEDKTWSEMLKIWSQVLHSLKNLANRSTSCFQSQHVTNFTDRWMWLVGRRHYGLLFLMGCFFKLIITASQVKPWQALSLSGSPILPNSRRHPTGSFEAPTTSPPVKYFSKMRKAQKPKLISRVMLMLYCAFQPHGGVICFLTVPWSTSWPDDLIVHASLLTTIWYPPNSPLGHLVPYLRQASVILNGTPKQRKTSSPGAPAMSLFLFLEPLPMLSIKKHAQKVNILMNFMSETSFKCHCNQAAGGYQSDAAAALMHEFEEGEEEKQLRTLLAFAQFLIIQESSCGIPSDSKKTAMTDFIRLGGHPSLSKQSGRCGTTLRGVELGGEIDNYTTSNVS
ncbi:hypothetical protein VP01_1599g1 [Puccinia sorghi]|uniref:Uncharacterized protein n=1 Tax=Puccinia sorghi TaxID=27349 RepID=A0A0L6VHY2_9BASI|nr:hypothetical protein VP01_1599g1 [Puccinia sorghi]